MGLEESIGGTFNAAQRCSGRLRVPQLGEVHFDFSDPHLNPFGGPLGVLRVGKLQENPAAGINPQRPAITTVIPTLASSSVCS